MAAQFIHYGSSLFDLSKFNPIENRYLFNKPYGGLWASPCSAELGWKDWCEMEDFNTNALSESFIFECKPDTNIIVIHNNLNLQMLDFMGYCIHYSKYAAYRPCGYEQYYLNFDKLLNDGYDAIQVFINNETYWSLYGWDCDSILILNPDCIYQTTE